MSPHSGAVLVGATLLVLGCARDAEPKSVPTPSPLPPATWSAEPVGPPGTVLAPATRASAAPPPAPPPLELAAPACTPADWSPHAVAPLLAPGTRGNPAYADQPAHETPAFDPECTDAPGGPSGTGAPVVIDGVELRLTSVTRAGFSGRQWAGNQCALELRLAGGAGHPVTLGPEQLPPFNAVLSLVRAGSAAWLTVGYNGYTREFPKGSNRVIALDLCDGKVVWTSPNSRSNTSLLLVGDALVTAYGFTSERHFVYVLDPRSGAVVQKLPVVENQCPSKAWAPNYSGGGCDAPGQRVGAATRPRIEDMLFVVDTNTGSATFVLER
ncbi:MAG TPA: hypothetical protein VFV94_10975 [Polyangiaceae bacterium]|nr:hypothetical protein [Polyangiaceae bacterium]